MRTQHRAPTKTRLESSNGPQPKYVSNPLSIFVIPCYVWLRSQAATASSWVESIGITFINISPCMSDFSGSGRRLREVHHRPDPGWPAVVADHPSFPLMQLNHVWEQVQMTWLHASEDANDMPYDLIADIHVAVPEYCLTLSMRLTHMLLTPCFYDQIQATFTSAGLTEVVIMAVDKAGTQAEAARYAMLYAPCIYAMLYQRMKLFLIERWTIVKLA